MNEHARAFARVPSALTHLFYCMQIGSEGFTKAAAEAQVLLTPPRAGAAEQEVADYLTPC